MNVTVEIHPRGPVSALRPPDGSGPDVAGVVVPLSDGSEATVAHLLHRHAACSLVVLHRGRLVHDWHRADQDPLRRHPSFSVTKSFVGLLTAAAVHEGVLGRDDRVGDVVPALAASGFGDATVGHLADMTAAVAYTEDYDALVTGAGGPDAPAPTADHPGTCTFEDYLSAIGSAPGRFGSLRSLLAAVGPAPWPHGEVLTYATPVTDALAWVLETATGTPFADAVGDRVWAHVGAERPARLLTDPEGTAVAGGGLHLATRDLARMGQWILDQAAGRVTGPCTPEVLAAVRSGGSAHAAAGNEKYAYLAGITYRDQWWLPALPTRPLMAWGIHGQVLWVSPDLDLVVATHADGPAPSDEQRDLDQLAMGAALEAAAAGW